MKHQISERVLSIEESKSVALSSVVARLRSEGKEIIGLNVGEPELPTPQVVIDATKAALDEGKTRYDLVPGTLRLRELIADRKEKKYGYRVSPNNIIVGSGSKNVIYSVLQTILNPGDEVIIPLPYWVTFPESVKLAGGIPQSVMPGKNFSLNLEEIKKLANPKTKAIIINSPNNPSGAIFPKEDLLEIARLAEEFDFYIIADEAYEAIIYPEADYIHMAELSEEIRKRTLTIQSFSKSFLMTGFRVGYLIADEEVVAKINKFNSHMLGNLSVYSQHGAIAALENEDQIINELMGEMVKRRDLAYKLFGELFPIERPDGAFYLFINVEKYLNDQIKTDIDLAAKILVETQVALLPGTAFGLDNHLRICFAVPTTQIQEAYHRLKGYFS